MYATRRLPTRQWNHQSPDERYSVQVTRGGKPVAGFQSDDISGVDEEVMYWRKANHIHKWFVDNVQGGEDKCNRFEIGWDNLKALADVCNKVIEGSKLVDGMVDDGTVYDQEHPEGLALHRPGKVIEEPTVARKLLPRQEGFFFGCQDYDEYYLNDVIATRDWAERMLADNKAGVPGYIYYWSSW